MSSPTKPFDINNQLEKKCYDNDTLRVCSEANQGMRKYMEDELSILIETEGKRTAFLGVFDGHGGKDASIYAKDHLYKNIKLQDGFYNDDTEKVKSAIRNGFVKTHWDMQGVVETWPKRKDGHNSTSGTTATIAIIRENKLFIAHVGDSAAVIATKNHGEIHAEELTMDHKPEDIGERTRIESLGGRVAVTNGVPRVVWKRAVKNQINMTDTCKYEYVPFLAVSRALGDLWSYDRDIKEFIVSPEPEVKCVDLKTEKHKFLILASDGLWGVMDGKEAVKLVTEFERISKLKPEERNSSEHLINQSLQLWQKKRSRADNISAVVVFFDDEFKRPLQSNEEIQDTDVCSSNEDDTPQMSDCDNSLVVRCLPFIKTKSSEGLLFQAGNELVTQGKRKNEDTTYPDNQKKVKNAHLLNSTSEDCSIVTVLSSESLYGLQLDEDFADDESDHPPSDHSSVRSDKCVKSLVSI